MCVIFKPLQNLKEFQVGKPHKRGISKFKGRVLLLLFITVVRIIYCVAVTEAATINTYPREIKEKKKMGLSNGKHLVLFESAGIEYPFSEYVCMAANHQVEYNLT